LEFLFKFRYHAQYDAHGAEYELCSVYAGRSSDQPQPNAGEVAAWRYVTPKALQAEIASAPDTFTPWFKLEWAHISRACPWLLDTTRLARPSR
jgi:isopentenyl-diphosphate delta-isomerase